MAAQLKIANPQDGKEVDGFWIGFDISDSLNKLTLVIRDKNPNLLIRPKSKDGTQVIDHFPRDFFYNILSEKNVIVVDEKELDDSAYGTILSDPTNKDGQRLETYRFDIPGDEFPAGISTLSLLTTDTVSQTGLLSIYSIQLSNSDEDIDEPLPNMEEIELLIEEKIAGKVDRSELDNKPDWTDLQNKVDQSDFNIQSLMKHDGHQFGGLLNSIAKLARDTDIKTSELKPFFSELNKIFPTGTSQEK